MPAEVLGLLDDIQKQAPKILPEGVAMLDLGSGSGSFVLSAAAYFDYNKFYKPHVTGMEMSKILLKDAYSISDELQMTNMSFFEKDIMMLTREDFKEYNVIYIFKPFNTNFEGSMDSFLPRIPPYTIVITRLFGNDVGVLRSNAGLFERIFSPLHDKYVGEFAVYRRTPKELDA